MRKGIYKNQGIWCLIMILTIILGGCGIGSSSGNYGSNQSNAPSSSTGVKEPDWGHATQTTGCTVQRPLQDKDCTPGDIFPDVTAEKICVPGYARSVRDVKQSTKNQVYANYGIKKHAPGQYEVDHLVSLQLGGSNDITNLWPESASPRPGFHEKDAVENYLHDQVCNGSISLPEAQIQIATNWLAVYQNMPAKDKTNKNPNPEP
jgi:hypothetical protein